MIWKPSKHQRQEARHKARVLKAKTKRAEQDGKREKWAAIALAAYNRDNGCSRASGRHLKFRNGSPFTIADPHHIIWKSAGGPDELWNVCTLDRSEHDRVHMRGNYKTRLEVEGNANETLTFREFDAETGKLIREWESPCPR